MRNIINTNTGDTGGDIHVNNVNNDANVIVINTVIRQ